MPVNELPLFFRRFRLTGRAADARPPCRRADVADFDLVMQDLAGATFEDGLYRVHDEESASKAMPLIIAGFPQLRSRISTLFAYDWRGFQYLLDTVQLVENEPVVTFLDPDEARIRTSRLTFRSFHNDVAVRQADDLFEWPMFRQWIGANASAVPLKRDECVEFRIPLMLGGRLDVDNLSLIDLEVHWHFSNQIASQTGGLPPGTKIRGVHTDP